MRLIFACDDDFLPVFADVESKLDLIYVRMHHQPSLRMPEFAHGRDLPDLGREREDTSVRSVSWLVTLRGLPLVPRRIDRFDGSTVFAIDQLANQDTIEVTPGGRLTDRVVLSGRIATVSDTKSAKQIMNAFRRAVKKSFERVNDAWVGPAAVHVLNSGGRLTMATQSPPEYDLVRVSNHA